MINPAKSMADDVKVYLVASGIPSASIYVNNAPKSKTDFILITDTGGATPEQYFPVDHPTVQVACYGSAYRHADTWTLIWQVYHLLNRKQNIMIGSRDAMYVRAMATPQVPGLDSEKKRWIMTFNVQFKIRGEDGQ